MISIPGASSRARLVAAVIFLGLVVVGSSCIRRVQDPPGDDTAAASPTASAAEAGEDPQTDEGEPATAPDDESDESGDSEIGWGTIAIGLALAPAFLFIAMKSAAFSRRLGKG